MHMHTISAIRVFVVCIVAVVLLNDWKRQREKKMVMVMEWIARDLIGNEWINKNEIVVAA